MGFAKSCKNFEQDAIQSSSVYYYIIYTFILYIYIYIYMWGVGVEKFLGGGEGGRGVP